MREELDVSFKVTALVMPAPQQDGKAGDRPLDSQEASAWLRLLLHGDSNVNPERKVSSHSMKATLLAFAARRGLPMDVRLQLGYHTGSFKMGLTYSRDGAAASLISLEQMLNEIKVGLFLPDETRSGRIRTQLPALPSSVVEVKDEEAVPTSGGDVLEETDDTAETSDESSSDESSEEDDYEPHGDGSRIFKAPEAPSGFTLWQHSKSKILHLMAKGNTRVFSCGRLAGDYHVGSGFTTRYDTPICGMCFTKAKQDTPVV